MSLTPARKFTPTILLVLIVSMVGLHGVASGQEDSFDSDEARPSGTGGSAASPWLGVEEMVVTGSSGVGLVLDAPTSVTAFDAAELEALGISDVDSIAAFTPNLEIRNAGSTTPILFIRGVGLNDFTSNAAGAVAVYQDDVSLNLPGFQSGQLFDVEGVSVLKGPQGSGPGRNASAGAIVISSKKPTGEFNATLRTDFGNYGYREIEGAVGVPVWGDQLAARFSFYVKQRDGIRQNTCGGLPRFNESNPSDPINLERVNNPNVTNQSQCGESIASAGFVLIPNPDFPPGRRNFRISKIKGGLDEDLNDLDTWALRGQLRFRPAGLDTDWILNLHGSRVDQLGTVGEPLGTEPGILGVGFLGSSTAPPNGYRAPEVKAEYDQMLERAGILNVPAGECRADPVCRATTERVQRSFGRRLASGRPLDSDPYKGAINIPGHERQEAWGGSLNGTLQFGALSLKSITGVERYDRSRLTDFDYTPSTIFEFDTEDDAWQVTQDIRLEQELESLPLTLRAGGFFLWEELDFDQDTLAGGDVRPIGQVYTQESYGLGVYGEFSWSFTDDFELLAGVRFNWERKELDLKAIQLTPTINVCEDGFTGTGANLPECDDRTTFSDPTGVVSLAYHFTEESSAYMKYSRGWKGQQYSASNGATRNAFELAKPETIDSVELGFNASWLDGRIAMNGALFAYRYDNYQVFLFTNDFASPPLRIVKNANDARLYGAELETRLEPIEQLVGIVRFGWLESKFLDFTDSGIRRIQVGPNEPPRITEVPIDFTGNRLPNTPRFKVSGSLAYTFDSERLGSLTPHYDFTFTDEFSFDPSNGNGAPNNQGDIFLPDNTIGQDAYILHNARLSWRAPGEMIEGSLWVRNITDETYKTLAFDASATASLIGNLVGDPRTYGVSIRLTY